MVDIIRRDPLGAQPAAVTTVVDHLDPDGRPTWLPTPQHDGLTPTPAGRPPASTPTRARCRPPRARRTATNGHGQPQPMGTRTEERTGTGPGAQADPPGVTGFGGVDVTDYV